MALGLMPTDKTSKEEARRGLELEILEKQGKISLLVQQVKIRAKINDIEVFEYTADFGYLQNGVRVLEEYKGFLYERHDFRLRMRVCSALYPEVFFKIQTGKGFAGGYLAGKAIRKTKASSVKILESELPL